ncbi:hypothetical protein BIW22_24855 [Salmonella enterica]|nr:hypothetical protein [Salmonella enterica]
MAAAHLLKQVVGNRHQFFRVGVGAVLMPEDRRHVAFFGMRQQVRDVFGVEVLHLMVGRRFFFGVHELFGVFLGHMERLALGVGFWVRGLGSACRGLDIFVGAYPVAFNFDVARHVRVLTRCASGFEE